MTRMLSYFNISLVFAALSISQPALASSSHLYSYINNPNVTRLEKLMNDPTSGADQIARAALFSGYAITYDFASSEGGAKKFNEFANTCYDMAFSTEQMKSVLGCYIVIDVVVTQIETVTKANIRPHFDEMLEMKLNDQGITDAATKEQIQTQFASASKVQTEWISTLSVKQVMSCLEFGIGKKCDY